MKFHNKKFRINLFTNIFITIVKKKLCHLFIIFISINSISNIETKKSIFPSKHIFATKVLVTYIFTSPFVTRMKRIIVIASHILIKSHGCVSR